MTVNHADLANAVRALAMDAVQAANSGHPGMPMGMADAATVLFTQHLKYDPEWPEWPDRDRFVLSAGHGSMLIYALLYLTGYEKPTLDQIRNFRQLGSPCAGHPENFELPGVETTTGPLGQGLATAVGMAIAERHLNARFGDAVQDHHTWVIAGDGCLMEGINHEAIGLAGHLKLGRLNVIWDDNRITIDGATSMSTSEDVKARYEASGWHVVSCDGHDAASIDAALRAAKADPRPSLIACRTIIGYGAPNKQGTAATHGSPLGAAEIAAARETLGWHHAPFEIPADILNAWRTSGARGTKLSADWKMDAAKAEGYADFLTWLDGSALKAAGPALKAHIDALIAAPQTVATRKASELALGAINAAVPNTIGGSADLTGSNNTLTKGLGTLDAANYGGRYVYYGIREFGMAAAMNGMALHGGIVPYGGTFLVFTDYCRPAIRLSALQRAQAIYVMTHDSIGLGEDGPTHQPIEHVMSLRVMPNVLVMRPADVVETAECWAIALENTSGPTVLALSRQNLPQVRTAANENLSAKGAYRLRAAGAARKVVFLATGSEVQAALNAADQLEADGIGCDVVSMPCWELFDLQSDAYQADILPEDALIVSVEAGTTVGWERYTGRKGLRLGIDRFGASAPAEALFEKFGLTADAIAKAVRGKLA
ncbi:transketolase [Sphingosinicella microcystinivorans]|uniref:Transketolase n=1 Tax=Sphingosinicella microcystinivorans TaxID=335406 RepID=A0AAD1D7S7_SPHMI|nr:transketolase [Sphingosinicella microcystinivorans]RKS91883.1 transketolase [Sphingosinicella microcystinivorans]BBE34869.1 transketolase [Sphingosinicella microcystinivorans]